MNRRDCFRSLTATAMALPGATAAGDSKGRFRSAICAYSFRDQLKAGSMTYADLIRMAADLGAEVETVRKWIDVAQRLGAGHVRVFGGAIPKGATEEQAVVWAVETLKRCAD